MNVFVLDNHPVVAAQLQCDKHVVKMIVESAQMLSTVHRMLDGVETRRPSKSGKTQSRYWILPDEREDTFYKAVHIHHPCTIWSAVSSNNYNWHYTHFVALCEEYTHRYGKVHSTDTLLREALQRLPTNLPIGDKTQFPLAMKDFPDCINYNDIVGSYRKFYQTKQARFKMVWSKRPIPEWFKVAA